MRAGYKVNAPKRPVNLSLNEDLIAQTRELTSNLSEVVESLLAEFLAEETARHVARAQALKGAVQTWNTFADKHGSFADEHSTL